MQTPGPHDHTLFVGGSVAEGGCGDPPEGVCHLFAFPPDVHFVCITEFVFRVSRVSRQKFLRIACATPKEIRRSCDAH